MTWNIPNTLTVLRLLAAPGVAIMFLYFDPRWAYAYSLILFVGAAVTDWFDGYLARLWNQQSKFGAMLDPIADKAMVVIALAVIVGFSERSWTPWLVLPATFILFREVFVSGLREYLGSTAGTLKVTKLAKWKTTAQMVAIAVLFLQGSLHHSMTILSQGMNNDIFAGILEGSVDDELGLRWRFHAWRWSGQIGLWLIWIAAILTIVTGWDYFRKALPFLRDEKPAE